MNRSSIFGLKIDFEKSKGSYLFDKITQRKYLDFMGMYATLVLGYNHPIFSTTSFKDEWLRVSGVKISNCEMLSDESEEFNEIFIKYTSGSVFSKYHYSCTGALAIEAAIKTAIDYKQTRNPKIISFKGSFHGINSYGGLVTSRFNPVKKRIEGFPGGLSQQFNNPVIFYENGTINNNIHEVRKVLSEIEETLLDKNSNIVGILAEPIQCTYGDYCFSPEFFKGIRLIADQFDIPLIFDEIQIGFGGTGKKWYFNHLDIKPDIVVFGKKTQLSGIMVKQKYSRIFDTPIRLEVTWDADLIDMIRCKYIILAFKKYNILDNVLRQGKALLDGLKTMKHLRNIRGIGLIIAFDFSSTKERNAFCKGLRQEGLICNPTREKTIRFRPNLSISQDEVNHALDIIKKVDNNQ